jgi:hypothetical protein
MTWRNSRAAPQIRLMCTYAKLHNSAERICTPTWHWNALEIIVDMTGRRARDYAFCCECDTRDPIFARARCTSLCYGRSEVCHHVVVLDFTQSTRLVRHLSDDRHSLASRCTCASTTRDMYDTVISAKT